MEAAEEVVATSANVLRRDKISQALYTNLLYVIGTLSAQALTVNAPEDFYKLVLD